MTMVRFPSPVGPTGWWRLFGAGRWRVGANIVVSATVVAFALRSSPGLLVGLAVAAAMGMSLEALAPLHDGRRSWRLFVIDLTHAVGNRCLIIPLVIGLLTICGPGVVALTPRVLPEHVASLPWLAQLALTVVATDFASYVAHRGLHRMGVLWRFHAIHHSSERLDWLATSRGHPIDEALNIVFATLPVYALGEAKLAPWLITFLFLYPFVVHANARVSIPFVGWLLVTPEFHHWHHAADPQAHDRNFGAFLSVWDHVFGTAFDARGFPARYGVDDRALATQDYLGQLTAPFRPARHRGAELTPTEVAV
jgi:sterol desaturase/sphingolipid hydroxylase (fatty acid hydroxylase superfamily)